MKYKAFTLIEMIILLSMFSIGILVILNLLTGNLNILDRVTLRIQSSFLAKEGIELVYNMRDSNLKKELPWNCIVKDEIYTDSISDIINGLPRTDNQSEVEKLCKGFMGSGENKILQVSFDPVGYMFTDIIPSNIDTNPTNKDFFDKTRLYIHSEDGLSWYSHKKIEDNDGSWFSRYIEFKVITEEDEILNPNKILKIESHVRYWKGGRTGEVLFESFIGDY